MAHDISSAEHPCHLAAQHLDGSIGMSQGVARRLCRPTALQPIGREVHAIAAQLQERFVRKHPERPRYLKAATVAAWTTAIRHQGLTLDQHRESESGKAYWRDEMGQYVRNSLGV